MAESNQAGVTLLNSFNAVACFSPSKHFLKNHCFYNTLLEMALGLSTSPNLKVLELHTRAFKTNELKSEIGKSNPLELQESIDSQVNLLTRLVVIALQFKSILLDPPQGFLTPQYTQEIFN